jgi:hypothetical protein
MFTYIILAVAVFSLVIAALLIYMGAYAILKSEIPMLKKLNARPFKNKKHGKRILGAGFLIIALILIAGLIYPFLGLHKFYWADTVLWSFQLGGPLLAVFTALAVEPPNKSFQPTR